MSKPTTITPAARDAWHVIRDLLRPWRGWIAAIAACVLVTESFAVIPSLLMRRIVDDHLVPGVREGILLLALFYWIIDACGFWKWSIFFIVFL